MVRIVAVMPLFPHIPYNIFPELDGYVLTKIKCSFQELSVESLQ
jgi:hypothetical protein